MKYFIVAGNYQQYKDFCNQYDLDRNEYTYIDHYSKLYGQDDVEVYYVGSYETRKDLQEIMETAQTRRRVNPYSTPSNPFPNAWTAIPPTVW